ncbi:MAG TPA: homoserine dehydrogenase [Blastocatellia bacterium]|nr:homoserine dehydrogenase [Blastocatellia bacterium]
MERRLAFIGFGNVARAFARIVAARRARLAEAYDLTLRTTAIATARHGCILAAEINLLDAAERVERGESLETLPGVVAAKDAYSVIDGCDADVLFETSPLDPLSGEPAASYIRRALARTLHVVTANKGPLAFAYRELQALAQSRGVQFRFEGTVMDGAPVFNLVASCLPGAQVLGFTGLLNSTTNIILSGMEAGQSFDEALAEAVRRGIAEANADFDIDGWDAAVKAVALANVLMHADARPADVERRGIRGITVEQLREAAANGSVIRLLARGMQTTAGVRLSVAPETLPLASPLGAARGSSNAVTLKTDLMGELTVTETDPGVEQTAYALLSDLLRIRRGN